MLVRRTTLWRLTACMIGLSSMPNLMAEAGVSGKSFSGQLAAVDGSFSGPSHIQFTNNGTVVYDELLADDPLEVFDGVYSEQDFVIVSFWDATFVDQSQDTLFVGSGICILGLLLTADYSNPDFSVQWGGTYFRSGTSPGRSASGVPVHSGVGSGGR